MSDVEEVVSSNLLYKSRRIQRVSLLALLFSKLYLSSRRSNQLHIALRRFSGMPQFLHMLHELRARCELLATHVTFVGACRTITIRSF